VTSVAPLLFDDVLSDAASRLGFAEVNALALCCAPDLMPQLLVTKTSSSDQCNGAERLTTEKPSRLVMAFVGSHGTGKSAAGTPNNNHPEEEAHHQSVVATQR